MAPVRRSVNSTARFCASCAPLLVARRDPPRHLGQQHGAGGDADDADRQLIETVGVVERGERAGREEARDDGVGEQRDLRPGGADDRRAERFEEALTISPSKVGQRNFGSTPCRNASPPTSSASRMPAMSTPQAAAWPARREEHRKRERHHHREVEKDRRRGRRSRNGRAR